MNTSEQKTEQKVVRRKSKVQTICVVIFLTSIIALEIKNIYNYIISFTNADYNDVITIVKHFHGDIFDKKQLYVYGGFYVYEEYKFLNFIFSLLHGSMIIYFASYALWVCWQRGLQSTLGPIKKSIICSVIWCITVMCCVLYNSTHIITMWRYLLMMTIVFAFMFCIFTDFLNRFIEDDVYGLSKKELHKQAIIDEDII